MFLFHRPLDVLFSGLLIDCLVPKSKLSKKTQQSLQC